MNYFYEIKTFYDRLELNPAPTSAIALWHALAYIANKTDKSEFTVASSTLMLKSGLSESSFKRARNYLTQNGYITWKSRGGNQAAVYSMVHSAVQYGPQSEPQSGPQSEPQSGPQSGPQSEPINKHNNTKTNTKKEKVKKEKCYFGDAELNKVFCDFVEMRKQIKRPMTDRAITMSINKLNELAVNTATGVLDVGNAIKILEQSILHCWLGLFPLKEEKDNAGRGNPENNRSYADECREYWTNLSDL